MDIQIEAPQNVGIIDGHSAAIQKFLLNFVDLQYDDTYSLRNNSGVVQANPAMLHAYAWSDVLRVKHRLAEVDPAWRTIHVQVQEVRMQGEDLHIHVTLTFADGAKADVAACIRDWLELDSQDSTAADGEGFGDSASEFEAEVEGPAGEQNTEGNSDT
jgi:hypothetical protein